MKFQIRTEGQPNSFVAVKLLLLAGFARMAGKQGRVSSAHSARREEGNVNTSALAHTVGCCSPRPEEDCSVCSRRKTRHKIRWVEYLSQQIILEVIFSSLLLLPSVHECHKWWLTSHTWIYLTSSYLCIDCHSFDIWLMVRPFFMCSPSL